MRCLVCWCHSVFRRWEMPKPNVSMRLSYPSASSGPKQTSLRRSSSGTSTIRRSTWIRLLTSRCSGWVLTAGERAKLCACASDWISRQKKWAGQLITFHWERSFHLKCLQQNYFVLSVQKEKSCDNIPKEPVVFEKMKLVSASFHGQSLNCTSASRHKLGVTVLFYLECEGNVIARKSEGKKDTCFKLICQCRHIRQLYWLCLLW